MPRRDGREAECMSEAAHSAKTQYENSVRLVLAREGAERIVREAGASQREPLHKGGASENP